QLAFAARRVAACAVVTLALAGIFCEMLPMPPWARVGSDISSAMFIERRTQEVVPSPLPKGRGIKGEGAVHSFVFGSAEPIGSSGESLPQAEPTTPATPSPISPVAPPTITPPQLD